jgi:hypothetical protein
MFRSMTVLLSAAVAVLACGCGGNSQPSLYKISVDPSPLLSLPASCYHENKIPDVRYTASNLQMEYDWYVWNGAHDTQNLDLNSAKFPQMGDSDQIENITDYVVSGTDDVFTGTWTEQLVPQPDSYSYVKTQSITVKFDSLGPTASGTITLVSNYSCTNCIHGENDGHVSCSASLNFSGRRIDADEQADYKGP